MTPVPRDIASTAKGDAESRVDEITIDSEQTDAAGEQKETTWINSKWAEYLGIYKNVPEIKIAIDSRALWTIGRGWTTNDSKAEIIFDNITGHGQDTFNTILKNLIITMHISGDAFAEIIWDDKGKYPINLKPLDPGTIKIVTNRKGRIVRYEQISKTDKKAPVKKFKPRDIFHLVNKRVADEIHGTSDLESLTDIVNALKESFDINKQIIKNFSRPKIIFHLDTDNQTKIDNFLETADKATNKGENIAIPQGAVKTEILSVPPNATLNVLPWREHLKNYFYQVVGIPQIILGSSGEFTESTAKIAYLAFQQTVEDDQLYIENQVWNQLFLRIELTFPASLKNELLSDESKDAGKQTKIAQPADMAVTEGT